MSYWAIIGRACLDDTFRASLLSKVLPGVNDTSQLLELWNFVCDTHDYRVSRWQLGDLNRLFGQIHPSGNDGSLGAEPEEPLQGTAAAWRRSVARLQGQRPLEISSEAHVLVGVCAIDFEVKGLYLAAARGPNAVTAIKQVAGRPPKFRLRGDDAVVLADFFGDPDSDALLTQIHNVLWIVPENGLPEDFVLRKVACAGGTIPTPPAGTDPYIYVSAPLLAQLDPAEVFGLVKETGS